MRQPLSTLECVNVTIEREHLAKRILAGVEHLDELERRTVARVDELAEAQRDALVERVFNDIVALAQRVVR